MRKTLHLRFLFLAIFTTVLSGCVVPQLSGDSPWRNEGKGVVIMPSSYAEFSPAKTFFGRPAVQTTVYYAAAIFRNVASGNDETVGFIVGPTNGIGSGGYAFASLPPGRYDLVAWVIGGRRANYDGQKCGRIGFDLTERDVLLLKGLRPVSIGDGGGGPLIGWRRVVNFAEFSMLPKNYEADIRAAHPDITRERSLRLIELTSESPTAFQACVAVADSKYRTLGDDEGTVSSPSMK